MEKTRHLSILIVSSVLAFLLNPIAHAEVYHWVDESGTTHYGDEGPLGATVIEFELPNADSEVAYDERLKRQNKLIDTWRKERERKEKISAEKERGERELRKKCGHLKAQLKRNERLSVFYRFNEKGKQEYYNAEQADAYRKRYKDEYAEFCSKNNS